MTREEEDHNTKGEPSSRKSRQTKSGEMEEENTEDKNKRNDLNQRMEVEAKGNLNKERGVQNKSWVKELIRREKEKSKLSDTIDDDDDDEVKIKPFTTESFQKLLNREEEARKKAELDRRRPKEGRLVDGELLFDDELAGGNQIERDPLLCEGNTLPERYGEFPKELLGRAVEEIDPNIKSRTFVVINTRLRKNNIYRFTASKTLFILSPWNPVRKGLMVAVTNQFFDYFIMLTILCNCVFLALDNPPEANEYVFLGIYSVEMILKVLARGFVLNPHTYLRDAWNWIDFSVILLGFITIILQLLGIAFGSVSGIRTFRVLRALKTISIFPGLKTIVNALLRSMRMFVEVLTLTLFCMMVFALFGIQVYMGLLRNKCVRIPNLGPFVNSSDNTLHTYYSEFTKDKRNWEEDSQTVYRMCGNITGAGRCKIGYACLPNIGENPNFGYTNFDHFGWAMLTSWQLITLDYWENAYNMILRVNGPWNILFFFVIVFFGSFYLVNLMLAVVTMSYEEEAINDGKEKERQKREKKTAKKKKKENAKAAARAAATQKQRPSREIDNIEFDPTTLRLSIDSVRPSEKNSSKEKVKSAKKESISSPSQKSKNGVTVSKTSLRSPTSKMNKANDSTNSTSKKNMQSKSEINSPQDSPSKQSIKFKTKVTARSAQSSGRVGTKSPKKNMLFKIKSGDSETGKIFSTPADSGTGSTDRLLVLAELNTHSGIANPVFSGESPDDDNISKDSGSSSQPEPLTSINNHMEHKFSHNLPSSTSHGANSNRKSVSFSPKRPVLTKNDSKLSSNSGDDGQSESSEHSIIVLDAVRLDAGPYILIDKNVELMDRNCIPCCENCCKTNYLPFLRAQSKVYAFVSDPLFELFIMISIVINTFSMTLEHYGMSEEFKLGLEITNYFFSCIFILECILKLFAMPKSYWKNRWNIFDFIIVLASIIDMGLVNVANSGLNVIRVCRLFRVFRLAQSWSTMRMLLAIIFSVIYSLGNLTLILIIFAYMFAVVGMNLFKDFYTSENFGGEIPRWNFIDFQHSLMMIFRVICGEWIEPMWDCMRAANELCMIVFLPALFVGNFMVLNLFVALLLNSFATDSMKKKSDNTEKEDNRFKQGWIRIKSIVKMMRKTSTVRPSDRQEKDDISLDEEEAQKAVANGNVLTDEKKSSNGTKHGNSDAVTETSSHKIAGEGATKNQSQKSNTDIEKDIVDKLSTNSSDENPKDENGNPIIEDCCPMICYTRCCPPCGVVSEKPWGKKYHDARVIMSKVVDHKAFETFILLLIAASSISLAFEDIYLDLYPFRKLVLKYLNITFAVLFTIEMLLKWFAYGYKKYFTHFWTILDFIIVVVSIASLIAEAAAGNGNLGAFRALRTLRAFRPLRVVSRWQGMKIVVNALLFAIPAIINVLLVCLIFWLIFSIMGVNFFLGKFHSCIDLTTGTRLLHEIVPNKTVCISMMNNGSNYRWQNADINFDHVGQGLLALLQVATFEGWMEVMESAVDSVGIDMQPIREHSFGYYIYFVIFIIFGSFFTLNLFIGVIIDNFNMLKKKYEGTYLDVFLTSSQRNYYNTLKKIGEKKPQKTIKRPKNKVQCFFFDISVSTKFELAIIMLIFLNMCAMAIEHYQQSETITVSLDIVNIIFSTVFILEAIVKIIGMRYHYFRRAWNVFDFVIVLLSIVGVILEDLLKDIFITPTLLRVVRIFRIGRVLRLIKAAKGIRKLLFALIISVPALFNIGALLFLIMMIYAIVGMSSFGHIKHNQFLDDIVNFETFERSFLLLFRLTTSAGWNDILGPMMIQPPYCNDTHYVDPNGKIIAGSNGDCGNPWLAIAYMVSFTMITFLIIINMYIAVILENFSQAHEQEEVGVTEDDFEMFYVIWERYDPHASQFIKFEQLSDLVADLDLPLGIPKPNDLALVSFNLPIVEGEKLHCLDILMALVKRILGDVEESEEFTKLREQMENKFKETFPTRVQSDIISTTMQRKKEDVAAKTLQRAWRKHDAQQKIRRITAMALANRSVSRQNSNFSGSSLGATPRRGLSPSRLSSKSMSLQVPASGGKSPTKSLA